jgi:hypothetical protein
LIQALKGYGREQRDEAMQKTSDAVDRLDERIDRLETRIDNNWVQKDKVSRGKARKSQEEPESVA